MKTQIFKNYEDFLNRKDREINGITKEFAEEHKINLDEDRGNDGCWNCSDCSDCHDCYDCSRCHDCSDCSRLSAQKENVEVPTIPNIHQTVAAAVKVEGALNMSDWHTCDTTHCRAGWVVHLAGEAGKNLEKLTSTSHAAMQIYRKSSPIKVSPPRFYESNEIAMKDILRCAEEEVKLQK